METKIRTLIQGITEHFEFSSIFLNEFIVFNNKPLNIVISTKDNVNYMIFTFIDFNDLSEICNQIQIEIFNKIKMEMSSEDNSKLFGVNKSLDKNSTLIVSTVVPDSVSKSVLNKLISSIEEESYYYKKQILAFSKTDNEVIDELISNSAGPVAYCDSVISSIDSYNIFTSDLGDNRYQLVAMLYEKLPFLTLKINSVKPLNLKEMIKSDLDSKQLESVELYRKLTTEKSVELWIDSIGVEND